MSYYSDFLIESKRLLESEYDNIPRFNLKHFLDVIDFDYSGFESVRKKNLITKIFKVLDDLNIVNSVRVVDTNLGVAYKIIFDNERAFKDYKDLIKDNFKEYGIEEKEKSLLIKDNRIEYAHISDEDFKKVEDILKKKFNEICKGEIIIDKGSLECDSDIIQIVIEKADVKPFLKFLDDSKVIYIYWNIGFADHITLDVDSLDYLLKGRIKESLKKSKKRKYTKYKKTPFDEKCSELWDKIDSYMDGRSHTRKEQMDAYETLSKEMELIDSMIDGCNMRDEMVADSLYTHLKRLYKKAQGIKEELESYPTTNDKGDKILKIYKAKGYSHIYVLEKKGGWAIELVKGPYIETHTFSKRSDIDYYLSRFKDLTLLLDNDKEEPIKEEVRDENFEIDFLRAQKRKAEKQNKKKGQLSYFSKEDVGNRDVARADFNHTFDGNPSFSLGSSDGVSGMGTADGGCGLVGGSMSMGEKYNKREGNKHMFEDKITEKDRDFMSRFLNEGAISKSQDLMTPEESYVSSKMLEELGSGDEPNNYEPKFSRIKSYLEGDLDQDQGTSTNFGFVLVDSKKVEKSQGEYIDVYLYLDNDTDTYYVVEGLLDGYYPSYDTIEDDAIRKFFDYDKAVEFFNEYEGNLEECYVEEDFGKPPISYDRQVETECTHLREDEYDDDPQMSKSYVDDDFKYQVQRREASKKDPEVLNEKEVDIDQDALKKDDKKVKKDTGIELEMAQEDSEEGPQKIEVEPEDVDYLSTIDENSTEVRYQGESYVVAMSLDDLVRELESTEKVLFMIWDASNIIDEENESEPIRIAINPTRVKSTSEYKDDMTSIELEDGAKFLINITTDDFKKEIEDAQETSTEPEASEDVKEGLEKKEIEDAQETSTEPEASEDQEPEDVKEGLEKKEIEDMYDLYDMGLSWFKDESYSKDTPDGKVLVTRIVLSTPLTYDQERELSKYSNVQIFRKGAQNKNAPEQTFDTLIITCKADDVDECIQESLDNRTITQKLLDEDVTVKSIKAVRSSSLEPPHSISESLLTGRPFYKIREVI